MCVKKYNMCLQAACEAQLAAQLYKQLQDETRSQWPRFWILVGDQSSSVSPCIQDYKSLLVAATICVSLSRVKLLSKKVRFSCLLQQNVMRHLPE